MNMSWRKRFTDGLAIWYKRLEQGTFQFPTDGPKAKEDLQAGVEITHSQLSLLLGVSPSGDHFSTFNNYWDASHAESVGSIESICRVGGVGDRQQSS